MTYNTAGRKALYLPDGRRLVFRVQCSDKQSEDWPKFRAGVYHGGLANDLLRETLNSTVHPSPWDDSGLRYFWESIDNRELFLFGFRDMDQLTNWFMWPGLMHKHRDLGEIGVYAVARDCYDDTVVDGQFQTIFNCLEAELIAVLPLDATSYEVPVCK